MSTTESPARLWTCTSDVYHADYTAVGNSMLKDFNISPRLYEGRYITRTVPPKARTKSLDLGTVGHASILEPHIIEGVCLEIPREVLDKAGKKSGKVWDAFEAENADRILLKPDELAVVRGMFESVYRNPIASKLLRATGKSEQSIRWTCRDTGLERKCRLDRLWDNGAWIVDVKTACDPSPQAFAKVCVNLGYSQQAAFYCDGVEALTGERPRFVFVVVMNEPPYTCRVYDLDERAREHGAAKVLSGLASLAERIRTGDWREAGEHEVVQLSLPNWAFTSEQWSM